MSRYEAFKDVITGYWHVVRIVLHPDGTAHWEPYNSANMPRLEAESIASNLNGR